MALGFATPTVNPKKLETGLRTNSAGIPYTLLLRIEAIGFPTFGLLLYMLLYHSSNKLTNICKADPKTKHNNSLEPRSSYDYEPFDEEP